VVYHYQFPAGSPNQLRAELEQLPLDQLVERLEQVDPEAAGRIDLNNPRRVIRAIETVGQAKQQAVKLDLQTLLIGLKPDDEILNNNIIQRTRQMVQAGLVGEVGRMVARFGPDLEPFQTVGYAEIISYLQGRASLAEAIDLINLHTKQLVRRQMTWFKRNPEIEWFRDTSQALERVAQWLESAV